jgi:serine/threonine-protein kinase
MGGQMTTYNLLLFVLSSDKNMGIRYQIKDRIYRGRISEIYKAFDTQENKMVALKKLMSGLSGRKEKKEFFQEADIAKNLSHPNIISVYGIVKDGPDKFLAMEFIYGENLKDMILNRSVDYSLAVNILVEVTKALNYIHNQDVIHRDIKPENILIIDKKKAKVIDFGFAKRKPKFWFLDSKEIVGSPSYISPEQIRGKRVDERTDIYSFGISMYEIFTGRAPYSAESKSDLMHKHLDTTIRVKPPSAYTKEMPPSLENIVMKSMEKDIKKRYQSTGEILADLNRCNIKGLLS